MSVWHIVTSEYPPDIGGVSDYTWQVANGLARAGDDVHVWCPREPQTSPSSHVHVHPELGRMRRADLRRVDNLLRPFEAPRRLLVQWVPHGFGYHSMNLWFCLWLARRARAGDIVELVVHEPYLEFRRGPLRHVAMACVHRLMTMLLLAAARRVWMSVPGWEPKLRPYALGRTVPMAWLPVPGSLEGVVPSTRISRRTYATDQKLLIGHFGSYGAAISTLLEDRLPVIMRSELEPTLLLLGERSEGFRRALLSKHPDWADRVYAAGYLPSSELAAAIGVCDVLVQPYPDGISSRRTTAMACLAQGRPVVSTTGHLTESLWEETGAVALVDVRDVAGFASTAVALLKSHVDRIEVGNAGLRLYLDRFSVRHVVSTLTAA